jgi:hypothetical protein
MCEELFINNPYVIRYYCSIGNIMRFVDRYVNSWILVSLCSLLSWILYWLPSSIERFYNVIFISADYYSLNRFWIYMPAGVGMLTHLSAVIVGLLSLVLLWKGTRSVFDLKNWVALALALEGIYYASLFPSGLWLATGLFGAFDIGVTPLGVAYLLQTVFTTPFLVALGFKVKNYVKDFNGFDGWKWVGFAFVGYISALWSNSVFRWFDMVATDGLIVFFSGIAGVGALNAFIFMSLAVIFAIIGMLSLVQKKLSSGIRWVALSLVMVGLHYAIYIIYSYYVDALGSVMLIDVWTIPLLGLGLALLRKK